MLVDITDKCFSQSAQSTQRFFRFDIKSNIFNMRNISFRIKLKNSTNYQVAGEIWLY